MEYSVSSLIVNEDITDNIISDSKLQTISTAEKVANSATTANIDPIANSIVQRTSGGLINANGYVLSNDQNVISFTSTLLQIALVLTQFQTLEKTPILF
jgi:hypothetical protein